VTVNGVTPALHLGTITYFENNTLKFFWKDPEPEGSRGSIQVQTQPSLWQHYYSPVLEIIQANPGYLSQMLERPTLMPVDRADVQISIRPEVLRLLIEARWSEAMRISIETVHFIESDISYQPDGIAVIAGSSWLAPFAETES
jgi:hypothetical protein